MNNLRRILWIIVLITTMSSCQFVQKTVNNKTVPELPADIPLDEFILGSWYSNSACNMKEDPNNYLFELEVLDSNTLKFIVLSSDGDFLDGITVNYHFVDTATIYVDNKRIQGGELWFLEREAQTLVVNRMIDDKSECIAFSRTINLNE